ncbi:MAG: phosphate acyltransferase PlsX [Gammaproteobacteria bacterium]
MQVCLAIDAMGGDHGPAVTVPATIQALALHSNLRIMLFGDSKQINAAIEQNPKNQSGYLKYQDRILIQHTDEFVAMDESPAQALRQKRNSSMRLSIDAVHNKEAQACVSAGNTGALMAIARFVLKTLTGVDRPAIITGLPSADGLVHVLDLGANVDCAAEHLLQFAVMGVVLVQELGLKKDPRVGLLNIGSEAIKGSQTVKEAAALLSQAPGINFIGFVEGDDVYKGTADIVVCDGFVGNAMLKASEGIAKLIFKSAKKAFLGNLGAGLIGLMAKPFLKKAFAYFDPTHYNGASLLGLQGIVVKSHGNASEEAFLRAIEVAITEVEHDVPSKISSQVADYLVGVHV